MRDAALRSKRAGFTLIELLATVAIIATLAALITPAYKGAMARRDAAVCLSNLRQTYPFYLADVNDNSMTIPLSYDYDNPNPALRVGWPDKLYTMLGGNYQIADGGAHPASFLGCPAERKKLGLGFNRRTMGINLALTDSQYAPTGPPKWVSFAQPSKTALLGDSALKPTGTAVAAGFNNGADKLPDAVHSGYANIMYMDGHAGALSSKALTTLVTAIPASGNGSDSSLFWLGR